MRFINVLLAITVSLAIGFFVLEGGLRLLGYGPETKRTQPHETLGWSKVPGLTSARQSDEYDVTLEFNELGLRDDPMSSPAKPEGVFRVLCLGDSFTLGYTVDRHDLFVDQLETWWNGEGRGVDVINAGTEAYSTDQEVLWLIENGEAFDPDLVLLFPYENDIYWNGQTAYRGTQKPRFDTEGNLDHTGPFEPPVSGGLHRRWAFANFWRQRFGERAPADVFVPEGAESPIRSEFSVLLYQPPGFTTDAVLRTGGALKALKNACDGLGAPLVIAPIPSHSAVDPEFAAEFHDEHIRVGAEKWSPDLPVDNILQLAETLDIASLDVRPALREATKAGEELYFETDWHLNPAGNRAFTRFLHQGLDQLGVFPEGHLATRTGTPPAPHVETGLPLWSKVFVVIWAVLTVLFFFTYDDEPFWRPPLLVGLLLGIVFTIVVGGGALLDRAPPFVAQVVGLLFVLAILAFVLYKLGRRLETIVELLKSFTLRGHWYLMPLVIVLVTVGSLLVVAASSPLVAPFIYTLF